MSAGSCMEATGFLFSHPCSQPGVAHCMRCEKSICAQHLALVEGETLCPTCAEEASEETDEDSSRDEDDPSYYYDDYGYYGAGSTLGPGATLGSGGSHDPNDFTEADGESLRHEDDASFEEDLGGS